MRRKVITTVVTFSTTTAAMKMERTAKESEFPGRLIPIPSDQCPVRTGMEMHGAIREGNRKIPEKKGTGLGWHLSCSGIKRILFVVCNKTEIFENFRIFIVK